MKERGRTIYIVLTVAVCSVIMSLIDGVICPQYAVKSAIKVVLFLTVPLIYMLSKASERAELKKLFVPDNKGILTALCLAVAVFSVIFFGYLALRNAVDFSSITSSLTDSAEITKENFPIVSVYIILVNSLVEEFFFRGFAFLTLKRTTNRVFAYVFSSVAFAFYHTGMTGGWFKPLLSVLMMTGLFVGGVIFDFLNENHGNIYTSWAVHMAANIGINLIGFILFGII